MGLTDLHTVLGLLLGRAFHSWQPRQLPPPLIPSSFPPALRALLHHPRFAVRPTAPLERWLLAGGLLANLPDADVLVALALQSWSRGHRGPSHSLVGCGVGAALLAFPLASWLRTSRTRALLFALSALASHLALDGASNAGVPLWWPRGGLHRVALGASTVWDAPTAALLYAALVGAFAPWSPLQTRPTALLALLTVALALYWRWKQRQLRLACGHFHARHLYAPSSDFWVHPWALWPRTFSLVRHDGHVVETVSTGNLRDGTELAYPNVADARHVRHMYAKNTRTILLDTLGAGALMLGFWGAFAYYAKKG